MRMLLPEMPLSPERCVDCITQAEENGWYKLPPNTLRLMLCISGTHGTAPTPWYAIALRRCYAMSGAKEGNLGLMLT